MKTPIDLFDTAIVGGGMVGMTLALMLQPSCRRIALIDATPITALAPNRFIALNGSSCDLLKRIGLEDVLATHGTGMKKIHVSCKDHFGSVHLSADEMGYDALGCVIPEKYIVHRLSALLSDAQSITLYRPERLTALQDVGDAVILSTESQVLRAKRVIGADGTRSTVRDLLGITTKTTHYHQSALVAELSLTRSHHSVAYERFQAIGAIAMLPLKEKQVAMIWTGSTDAINRLTALDSTDFLKELQMCFGYRLGRFQHSGHRLTYPLLMQHASQQIKGRVLLVGNAAHTLHPIAAQGLNLALREIAQLSDYWLAHSGRDEALDHFSFQTKQADFSSKLSHGLTALFSKPSRIFSGIRSVGLVSFDLCTFAKAYLTRSAMGYMQDTVK